MHLFILKSNDFMQIIMTKSSDLIANVYCLTVENVIASSFIETGPNLQQISTNKLDPLYEL